MELMFLVYAVENLTYNNSFFMSVATWLFFLLLIMYCIKGIVYFYNENQKELSTITKFRVKLSSDDTFILDHDVYDFKAGEVYIVSSAFTSDNTLYYYGTTSEGYSNGRLKSVKGLKHIEELLSKQKGEQVSTTEAKKINLPNFHIKSLITIILFSLMLHTFLPSRQTAIYMAGAYLIQEVATSDSVQELGKASYNAAVSQLNKWSSEVPELAEMVADAGLESAKKKAVEVIGK